MKECLYGTTSAKMTLSALACAGKHLGYLRVNGGFYFVCSTGKWLSAYVYWCVKNA